MMRGELNGENITAGMLADQLSNVVGRSVIDKTGLAGSYDFTLKYTPEGGAPMPKGPDGADPAPSDAQAPSIFAAVQEQLGLKLEAQRGPVDLYIIDRVEKPSEN
jgi:bla regulator protein blaR1